MSNNITIYDLGNASKSSPADEKEESNAVKLLQKRVDAVISSLTYSTKYLSHYKLLFKENITVIFLNRLDADRRGIRVIMTNYTCGYLSAKYLIGESYRFISIQYAYLKRNNYSRWHSCFSDTLKSMTTVTVSSVNLMTKS